MPNYYPHRKPRPLEKEYESGDELSLGEVGSLYGCSGIVVNKLLRDGRLRSKRYEDVKEYKVIWDKERLERERMGAPLSGKVVNRIMKLALLLEGAYGVDVFKKRMAIIYNTTSEEVGRILESRVFVKRRVQKDMEFMTSNTDDSILEMAKRFSLNPETSGAAQNKLLEFIAETVRQKGTGKKWVLKEVGDKGDKQLKDYELKRG